jgi:hypothetical protein
VDTTFPHTVPLVVLTRPVAQLDEFAESLEQEPKSVATVMRANNNNPMEGVCWHVWIFSDFIFFLL